LSIGEVRVGYWTLGWYDNPCLGLQDGDVIRR